MKQQSLFTDRRITEFGGSLMKKGQRKVARPLNLRSSVHLVLKAEESLQLFKNSSLIKIRIHKLSKKFGIKVYSIAVHEDHIHGVFKFPSRRLYRAWIRSLTGTLCRQVKGLKWRYRPYSKILTWGKQFRGALAYLKKNNDEATFLNDAWNRFEEFETALKEKIMFPLRI